ncbi:MAG TPA: NAD(P)/FAD-dependent oxidoreductase [Jiangellales bacterium]|nr:NAD(P)/FAD-dependent oxidoreductase [Jiangellales bacterium]
MTTHVDVAVIGGGQAGLATSYELSRRGLEHVVLDAAPEPGHAWRSRWDSLRLFTPAWFSGLPGMPFPGDPGTHPSKDQVADYLAGYAARFALPVRHGIEVTSVRRAGDAFRVETATGAVRAAHVVVATGAFQRPVVPALAAGAAADVVQVHTAAYRRPSDLPAGTVLVVGGGNSGLQVAVELAGNRRRVVVAEGTRATHLPQRLLGRDVFRWLDTAGAFDVTPGSRRGRRMRGTQLVIGTSRRSLRQAGVERRPRLVRLDGTRAAFADGTAVEVDAVVWATGFRTDHAFVDVDGALDEHGAVRQHAGAGAVAGLWTVGLPWQSSRGSALLGRVGRDAAAVADRIAGSAAPGTAATTATRQRALAG